MSRSGLDVRDIRQVAPGVWGTHSISGPLSISPLAFQTLCLKCTESAVTSLSNPLPIHPREGWLWLEGDGTPVCTENSFSSQRAFGVTLPKVVSDVGADGKALLCNTVLASQWTMKKPSSHHFVQNKDCKVEIVSMAATPLCLHAVPFSLIWIQCFGQGAPQSQNRPRGVSQGQEMLGNTISKDGHSKIKVTRNLISTKGFL